MGYTYLGVEKVAILVVVVCVLWLGLVSLLSNPGRQKNVYFPLDAFDREKFQAIEVQEGIIEWYINESQNTIIVKYDALSIQEEQIIELSVGFRKGV
ncbi:hypothetical protein ASB1_04060 [Helicobacter heilmannii]|nr:hypothetical protein ASB1_04060 [Helicobacter heilmannii]